MDFSDFMEVQRRAKERDPKEFARGVAADEKQAAKAYADAERAERRAAKAGGGGGGGGGGGADLEKGMMGGRMKKPTYKKGGVVSSASKRADGCAIKGKTKGRMI